MNKNAIQKYAIWARNELIEQVKQRAYQYGISEKGYGDENASVIAGRVLSADEKQQRQSYVGEIKKSGYKQAVEEVAYTWFNRFVALRYMEVNDFLPTHVRVFSDPSGSFKPEILTNVLHLDLPGLDKAKVSKLLHANVTEELYRYLLLTQCNALNELLPEMFERMGAYTEMLLPNNILKPESVIGRLVKDIPEEDLRDAVQIIGWLYQYYNTEPKQAVFDGLKKNIKITKENIPAATQLFTPDWIVRYMVENSLGRLWLESHPNSTLREGWKYYLDEAEQTPEVAERLRILRKENAVKSPEDIKLIDPCMGSGHILVYAFDVLMQIYTLEGYSERDAAKLILEKNLYGLEIDRRAYQLAYFALMMKARQYNRRILTLGVRPQVYEPTEYADGMEYGSLVRVEKLEPMPEPPKEQQMTIFEGNYEANLNAWNFRRLLAQKYDVVVTNPPYMGSSGMGARLSEFVKKNYPDSKSDLFAVFIERCGQLIKSSGYQAMITQHAWMFLSSYEKLRGKLLRRDIVNMAHLGARAFEEIGGEVVQTTAFVMSARKTQGYMGTYARLVDFGSQNEKETAFLSGEHRHTAASDNFAKIPGSPVAYWVSKKIYDSFDKPKIGEKYTPKFGMSVGDGNEFIRLWFEVSHRDITFNAINIDEYLKTNRTWNVVDKGGQYRKWYGNRSNVVRWKNDGQLIRQHSGSAVRSPQHFFKPHISWTLISASSFSARYFEEGFILDTASNCLYKNQSDLELVLGLLNSRIAETILPIINPTLNMSCGVLAGLPYLPSIETHTTISELVKANISLSRADWDAFETSWDFTRHPLIAPFFEGGAPQGRGLRSPDDLPVIITGRGLRPYANDLKPAAQELRKNATRQENHLWYDFLKDFRPRFTRQRIVGRYILDFFCPQANLVIELDGFQHFEPNAIEYDRQRTEFLASFGIEVLRFPNVDIDRNFEGVCGHIQIAVQERTQPPALRATPFKEGGLVAAAFAKWEREAAERFDTLKANEEELNRIFIDIYGLQDELDATVEDKDVTVRRADLGREIRSLISYAVGCMFGRYSLDVEGLVYAGGKWDADKYRTFPADKDNILPICDDEYFDDDIAGRFANFVKTVYGADTLEENLKFIADALNGRGTPREVIRNYFLNDFYKDHLKIYQKRPIYWLFDSGKKNGFKALIYMHRYSRDLLAKLRTDYVHEQQERYRTQLSHIVAALNTATGAERARLLKQQDKLSEQAREIGMYEEKVHHLADQSIAIDLDDGVKKNYEIFADILAKI